MIDYRKNQQLNEVKALPKNNQTKINLKPTTIARQPLFIEAKKPQEAQIKEEKDKRYSFGQSPP